MTLRFRHVYNRRPQSLEQVKHYMKAKSEVKTRQANTSDDPIRDFYTSHPFPPAGRKTSIVLVKCGSTKISIAPNFICSGPTRNTRADLDVLVAGCGTWQAAKHAVGHPLPACLASMSVSTSLEQDRKTENKLQLNNLELESWQSRTWRIWTNSSI
jgi:hypothetical protein